MQLPAQLETLRERKIWVCYPMIYNPSKHNGVGGYDKPPINPYTLDNAKINDATNLSTFDEAAAHIGEITTVTNKGARVECEVMGVGIALGFTGLIGVDLDNVVAYRDKDYKITREADEIITALASYTELSPSHSGIHILIEAEIPDDYQHKAGGKLDNYGDRVAEYELLDKGYITISGVTSPRYNYPLAQREKELADVYARYIEKVPAIDTPCDRRPEAALSVVSWDSVDISKLTQKQILGGVFFSYERWLWEVQRLSDAEILNGIFMSGSTGEKVRRLYNGDITGYKSQSEADLALMSYFYKFTQDRAITERLFRCSALYRARGKSRNYIEKTLDKAERDKDVDSYGRPITLRAFTGHVTLTKEERRAYAQAKEAQEREAQSKNKRLRPRI